MASPSDIIKMIEEKDVKFVDLRFSDTKEKNSMLAFLHQHLTNQNFRTVMRSMALRLLAGRVSKPLTCY